MPRLNILRHHRRSSSNQGNTTSTSAVPLPIASASSTNLVSSSSSSQSQPPPRTSPPSVPPLDALPLIDSGSPGLGSPGQWLMEGGGGGTAGSGTSNSSNVSEPPPPATSSTTTTTTKTARITVSAPPPQTPRARQKASSSAKSALNAKSTLSQQVKAANAALAAQPSSVTAPAGGSHHHHHHRHHHNLSSNSSSNNAANHSASGGQAPTTVSSYRRNAKLTLLNPMSLLMRRRSSQASSLLSDNAKARSSRDLPDDFDPGIIYGTRHPDWSNPPKRGQNEVVRPPVNGRSISPLPPVSPLMDPNNKLLKVEVVADDAGNSGIDERLAELERQRTPVFREHFDDEVVRERGPMEVGRKMGEVEVTPVTPVIMSRISPEPPRAPTTNPPPVNDLDKPRVIEGGILPSSTGSTTQISRASSVVSSNEGELDDGKPRGVTLVDHPLSLPHHLMTNSSRFSFEASSAAESNKDDEPEDPYDDGDDRDDDELGLELDFGGDDDEGFSRANEGLFVVPNDDLYGDEDYLENEGGVPLALGIDPNHGTGIALSKDSPIDVNTPTTPLNLVGMSQVLPTMDPEPAVQPDQQQQSLVSRLGNPRGLDLSDDSDFDELEQGNEMAGYEDDDDDLYFDDGIILEDPTFQGPVNNTTQEEGEMEEPMNKEQRDSFPSTLGVSSGGAMEVEDGSLDSMADKSNDGTAGTGGGSGYGNKSFPPFLNPIGGGLGCTQQHAQFYAPDGTMLDEHTGLPLALSTLTQQLYQYQKQQQREAEAAAAGNEINSPGAISNIGIGGSGGYESDYAADWGSQSGYYSIDDDDYEPEDADDSMVAEANAEALAYDTEFYGQEFGFYPVSAASSLLPAGADGEEDENVFAGGYFGITQDLPSRPIIRRPSLTPISERSEGSYRNSLVFPLSSSRPLSVSVPAGEDLSSLIISNSASAEITLEQLMRLRRNAWGGSNGSLRSSRAHSPVPANSSLLAQGGLTPPVAPLSAPPGLGGGGGGGMGAPPGLSHPGKNAMLPTKGSFEDVGFSPPPPLQPPQTPSDAGTGNGRSTADSSYASAVGSPIIDDAGSDVAGDSGGAREGWVFSPAATAASST
ncbi:hypothetical protein L873DRAFT_1667844 [Choiromyces venosus 120613-1]|uniref:AGC-kinase C-terminal domain-containing protein n=1 Tax=Choiromyces venosus 120613-1 TaxID=1336337 RepID=A0A3N4K6F5_9PEZI|nr:hypothetical protein L873DRAFT_1667844 [Choiromyces venosus 120613-1]